MANPMEKVLIDYTNWRGIRSKRYIRPISIRFENSEFHPETQWVLEAVALDKNAIRSFAMKDIHSWVPVTE